MTRQGCQTLKNLLLCKVGLMMGVGIPQKFRLKSRSCRRIELFLPKLTMNSFQSFVCNVLSWSSA